ncbi:MAG: carbon starvation protein A [Pirellulaceae bacterium]|nr:carbon starvation protein A [Pirellulaceae bacterium]HJN10120.1 carbon starvation protein A [Pirellulaceae bacterium]
MSTLLVALASMVGFVVAYHTYGRWLSRKIFGLDVEAKVPSQELRDDVDFVPTKKSVIFGHHFTSIAGTGPIVGPAIAVFWGWLPALLWVVLGSIFIGAVHDFGALVVSLRNRGQTVGEVAGRLISPRARVLFLLVLFFALTVVLAIFGLVIALIFAFYPESVLPVWISMPLAVGIGYWCYRRSGNLLLPSLVALVVIYASIYVGAYYLPINVAELTGISLTGDFPNVVVMWTFVLLAYCFVASVLPVWLLLQPRDYINSHQLVVALVLLIAGLVVAGVSGQANLTAIPAVAPAANIPVDAPPIFPFLFITIACGACSGFHCLVSSGTTSKQIARETDAQYVGYGAMLLEGGLAVVVILACCAGVGMGLFEPKTTSAGTDWVAVVDAETGVPVTGMAAWQTRYDVSAGWSNFKLKTKVQAFVEGGANFLSAIGIPLKLGVSIVAVLVACFAATTLDTATRLQRYVIQELATTLRVTPLANKYVATGVAVGLGGALAMMSGSNGPGSGGLILWPLFGAVNQLLAGLALMVTVFYLWRRKKPVMFALIPMVIMLILPAWAMLWQMFNTESGWWWKGQMLLFSFGAIVMTLQVWMVIEAVLMFPRVKGVLEESLPPLPAKPKPALASAGSDARSC